MTFNKGDKVILVQSEVDPLPDLWVGCTGYVLDVTEGPSGRLYEIQVGESHPADWVQVPSANLLKG